MSRHHTLSGRALASEAPDTMGGAAVSHHRQFGTRLSSTEL